MPIEIERKFLVDGDPAGWDPPVIATAAWVIRQGYVTRAGDDPEVRVRHAVPVDVATALDGAPRPLGTAAVVRRLTTKAATGDRAGGAVTRHEVEVDVPEAAFDELWAITDGRRVEKVRVAYRFGDPAGDPTIVTVDHFRGPLAGLRLAEIEFANAAASRTLELPGFLGLEVTDDGRYRNQALAVLAAPPNVPPAADAAPPRPAGTTPVPDPGADAPGLLTRPAGQGHRMAYEIAPDEPLGAGLRRSAADQLRGALESLGDGLAADPADAVHDARKRLKKTRALLRLARPVLGRKVARRENMVLRTAAASLSATRDAEVLGQTVDALADRYAGQVPSETFDAVRRAVASGHATGTAPAVDDAIAGIRSVLGRVGDWPLDDATTTDVLAGESVAYAAGHAQLPRAGDRPTADQLHEWRKRVKDLWYHGRLLQNAWPAVMAAQAEEAHLLSEILGDDHDLAVLRDRLTAVPDDRLPVDVDAFLGLVDRRRAALLDEALTLGRRVYAEKPKAHAARLRRYVADWQRPAAA